ALGAHIANSSRSRRSQGGRAAWHGRRRTHHGRTRFAVSELKGQTAPLIVRHAAADIIGAELLSGKVRDENLFALSGTLRALGIELGKVVFCPDKQQTIAEEVRSASSAFDVVFTSGGVGPTHDDVTVDGVCEALG